MTTVKVELVANRSPFEDSNYGTGLVWAGPGDVQNVEIDKWASMQKHADVWRLVEDDEQPAPDDGLADVVDPFAGMDDAAIHAFAKERGLKVHHKVNGANLRAVVSKALA